MVVVLPPPVIIKNGSTQKQKNALTSSPSELAVVGGPGGVQVLQALADDIGFNDVPLIVAHRPPMPHVEDLDVPLVRRPAPDQPQGPLPDIAGLPGPVLAAARSRLGKSHQEQKREGQAKDVHRCYVCASLAVEEYVQV